MWGKRCSARYGYWQIKNTTDQYLAPLVWTEPKFLWADLSTLRTGSSRVFTSVLWNWHLACRIQLVQLLFLEGPDPWNFALLPSSRAGSESFPAGDRNVAGMYGLLEGVSKPLRVKKRERERESFALFRVEFFRMRVKTEVQSEYAHLYL